MLIGKVFITPGKVIDKFMENLDIAFKRNYVRKTSCMGSISDMEMDR